MFLCAHMDLVVVGHGGDDRGDHGGDDDHGDRGGGDDRRTFSAVSFKNTSEDTVT